MSLIERSERERVAIAIYEARVHAAIINGWDAEPAALRERFLKAADAALNSSGAVCERDRLRAENERLRVLIGRAPHARHCEASSSLFPGACSCWKKDAATVPELVERSRALGPVMEAQSDAVAEGLRDAADRMRGGE